MWFSGTSYYIIVINRITHPPWQLHLSLRPYHLHHFTFKKCQTAHLITISMASGCVQKLWHLEYYECLYQQSSPIEKKRINIQTPFSPLPHFGIHVIAVVAVVLVVAKSLRSNRIVTALLIDRAIALLTYVAERWQVSRDEWQSCHYSGPSVRSAFCCDVPVSVNNALR